MRHSLRVVATATCAPWVAFAAMAVAQAFLFGSRGMPWRGEYFWSAQWIEGNSFPALVITSVAIAVDSLRTLGPRRANLVTSGDVRGRFLLAYCLVTGVAFALPMLAAFGLSARWWNSPAGQIQFLSSIHMLVSLLSMLAILGLCLLLSLATSIAGLVLTPLAALWMGLTALDQTGVVVIGNSTGSLLGFAPAVSSLVIQGLTAVLLLALSWVGAVRWSRHASAVSWASLGVFALVLVVASSSLLDLAPYKTSDVENAMCYGDGGLGSTTCVSQQHSRFSDPLEERFQEMRQAADDLGVSDSLPRTVVEAYTPFYGRHVDPALRISPTVAGWQPNTDELASSRPTILRESLVGALVTPLHCQQLRAQEPPSPEYDKLRESAFSSGVELADPEAPLAQRRQAAQTFATAMATLRKCSF